MGSNNIYYSVYWVNPKTICLLDFVHRPDKILKYNIKSRRFGSWFFFRRQVMGGETSTQMGPFRLS
jgi:hypothetical protein